MLFMRSSNWRVASIFHHYDIIISLALYWIVFSCVRRTERLRSVFDLHVLLLNLSECAKLKKRALYSVSERNNDKARERANAYVVTNLLVAKIRRFSDATILIIVLQFIFAGQECSYPAIVQGYTHSHSDVTTAQMLTFEINVVLRPRQ